MSCCRAGNSCGALTCGLSASGNGCTNSAAVLARTSCWTCRSTCSGSCGFSWLTRSTNCPFGNWPFRGGSWCQAVLWCHTEQLFSLHVWQVEHLSKLRRCYPVNANSAQNQTRTMPTATANASSRPNHLRQILSWALKREAKRLAVLAPRGCQTSGLAHCLKSLTCIRSWDMNIILQKVLRNPGVTTKNKLIGAGSTFTDESILCNLLL